MTIIKIFKTIEVLTAVVCITVIEMYALSQGINGTALSLSIAGVAGLGGFELQALLKSFKKVV